MENKLIVPGQSRIFATILGVMIVVFAILTLIAGLPPADQRTNFVIGIIVLIAVTSGIGLLGWHFLIRSLPANIQVVEQPLLTTRSRQIVALILTLGTLSIGIAGVWDEIWHVKYGIPFGQDFFWRPHLMLYFGLSTLVLIGGWSWWTLMTRGKGTLQQRFRANPLLGISFLGGLFTVYAVGADPIWHKFYGSDLAPWSLPHLLILMLIFAMATLGTAYHKSLMPQREWSLKVNFHWRDLLILLITGCAMLAFTIILTVQWYSANGGGAKQLTQIMTYPTWMLAVFITFLASMFGTVALHSTRRIGSATLVAVLTFVLRLVFDTGLGSIRNGTTPILLIIPLMLSLDIWYAIALRRTGKPPAILTTAIVVAAVYGVVVVPLTSALFSFVSLTPLDIIEMVVASFVVALGILWLGRYIGGLSAYGGAETASAAVPQAAVPRSWSNALLYVVFLAFVVVFVATATPPV